MITSFSFDSERIGVASNLFQPSKTAKRFLLFFRLFRLRRFSPVVLRHRCVESLTQNHLHGVSRFTDHFRCNFQLRFFHRPQHVFLAASQRMIRPATQPQPCKFLRADRTDHGLRAVVASRAAVRMNPNRSQRQLRFVPHHQQIRQIQLVLPQQLPHRNAAEIHIRLRLCQEDFFPGDFSAARQRRDERYFFFSPFSPLSLFSPFSPFSALGLASASAPSSPSTSFLPFLMTSGSAGVAASVATTSAGFSSSTFSATTCANTRSGSVINFILAVSSGNSLARNCLPSINPLTSILNSVGISAGKHSISTSRVTTSNTPPCTFTPEGSPKVCTGTFTFIRTSMATRTRSTCSNFPVMGSTSQSFRIAGSCLPPRST